MKKITNLFIVLKLKTRALSLGVLLGSSSLMSAQTVVDIVVNSEDHTTLEAAVLAAGLEGTLSGEGPFTVFAPTDAAFAALPAGTVEALLEDIPALTAILTYHVVGAQALSTDLSDGLEITTVNGKKITVHIDESGVSINGVAMVIAADVMADNGVVHVIDAVLIPDNSTSVRDELVNAPSGLSIQPNPASSQIEIVFSLESRQAVNVEIFNLAGQLIQSKAYGVLQTGSNRVVADVSALNNGIYMLVVKAGSHRTVTKLQVRR